MDYSQFHKIIEVNGSLLFVRCLQRKVVKNTFLTRHGLYNINSNRKIVSKIF